MADRNARTRRPNGSGSVTTRPDGVLQVRAVDPATGQRIKRNVARGVRGDGRVETPAQYRKRAEQALAELRRQLAQPSSLRERWTLTRYFQERYLPAVEPRLKPRTFESYGIEWRLYVAPYLGGVELSAVDVDAVDRLDRQLAGRGMSLATRRKARGHLSRTLRHAVAKGRLTYNPCVSADRLASDDRDRTTGTLQPEEVRALLAAARGTECEAAIALLGLLGLRRGEVLGLVWEAVDLDAGLLRIERSMATLAAGRLVLGTPKTAGSRRTLSLSPACVAALRSHRARQAGWRLSAGEHWTDTFVDDCGEQVHLVFTDEAGRPLPSHRLNDALDRIAVTAGVGHVHPHRLRHSAASLMIANGADVATVSGVLGHASPAVTLSVYSHALGRSVTRATEAIADAVGTW